MAALQRGERKQQSGRAGRYTILVIPTFLYQNWKDMIGFKVQSKVVACVSLGIKHFAVQAAMEINVVPRKTVQERPYCDFLESLFLSEVLLQSSLSNSSGVAAANTTINASLYPSDSAPLSSSPEIIYGLPCEDSRAAHESADLRSLEHMDTHYHIHLIDYNYKAEECEFDKNRSLLRSTIEFTDNSNDRSVQTLGRCQSIFRLTSALNTVDGIINASVSLGLTEEMVLVNRLDIVAKYEPIMDVTTNIYSCVVV
ncbi:hypothetical protein PR202_ga21569 [Eleusine coracana subsp. coracana]|uniref:Uncharacterized protein n=1 Tax=Eleusine coracana subsp. coracana TaxID=191504 RepID=A0AAV5D0B7_ELECO|nr:hypothetical protein PR202_ga21569 [Eleusine coracana subsp. coracana]